MAKKRTILYIGNQLQGKGLNPTTVDTLGDKLENDFTVIRASHFGNPVLRLLHMWWKIVVNAKRAGFLLIDTYSTSAFTFAWTSARLAKLVGLKYIPFLHGGDLPLRYQKDREKCDVFFRNAHAIVSPSGYLQFETEQAFGVKVTVIPNYLELEKYPFTLRENAAEIKLLWVRAFHEIYNPSLAVAVVKLLIEKGVKTEITMVGPDKDGSMEMVKKLAEKEGVLSYFTFTGRMPKEDWLALSADFNIFINTTNADNTPVSVMEAMALGFPVVTTNVGGIPYLFENAVEGIQVPANDANAMAKAILELKESPQTMGKISRAARAKAESWAWEEVRKLWNKLL